MVLGEDLPDRVDIIVSEWMGFCLLSEGMLDSVLFARDHFLVKGGLIFPERAKIFVAGVNDQTFKMQQDSFYSRDLNPYGISMKSFRDQKNAFVAVDRIEAWQIISTEAKVFDVDINTCKVDDLQFSSEYSLTVLPRTGVHSYLAR